MVGGGPGVLLDALDQTDGPSLGDLQHRVGLFGDSHADEAFFYPAKFAPKLGGLGEYVRLAARGATVRDWVVGVNEIAVIPHDKASSIAVSAPQLGDVVIRRLWPYKSLLGNRSTFGGGTYFTDGRPWYEWHQLPADSGASKLAIHYAEIESRNHFVLVDSDVVFNRTAPVIKLPATSSLKDHISLVGILNSSVAEFWIRNKAKPKGGPAHIPWARTFQLNATFLKKFPLPSEMPSERVSGLIELSRRLEEFDPLKMVSRRIIDSAKTSSVQHTFEETLKAMISEQEELDWDVYQLYGLIDEQLSLPPGRAPAIALGERAFEISLARQGRSGADENGWFERHEASAVRDIPGHWPTEYQNLVERRLEAIATISNISIIERCENKRRWQSEAWSSRLRKAAENELLTKLENPSLWLTRHGTPVPMSVGELAGLVALDDEFNALLDLWTGRKDAPVTDSLTDLLSTECASFLAVERHSEAGLRKRSEWERVWSAQRNQEKLGLPDDVLSHSPPRYERSDFADASSWANRNSLDTPLERFISYPGMGRATDTTPLLGWARWDHAQQGLALATIFSSRESEGAPFEELIPLVAGLDEVLPWVRQWHGGVDPNLGVDMVEYLEGRLVEMSVKVQVPVDELNVWRR